MQGAVNVLVNWRRNEVAKTLIDNAERFGRDFEKGTRNTARSVSDAELQNLMRDRRRASDFQASIQRLKKSLVARDLQMIGARKGNVSATANLNLTNAARRRYDDIFSVNGKLRLTVHMQSELAFHKGQVGHVFSGIVAMKDAVAKESDRGKIFLGENGPPTAEEQRIASIREPYINRPFQEDTRVTVFENQAPLIVHGRAGTSHSQLLTLIKRAEQYADGDDELFLGFTVQKGGWLHVAQGLKWVKNVYAWTSSSTNMHAQKRLETLGQKSKMSALEMLMAGKLQKTAASAGKRVHAVLDRRIAEMVRLALDNLLERGKGRDRSALEAKMRMNRQLLGKT